ncbi:MAG TPA: AgmX/PglI C-terminal domain-containing protein [Anaeromyxobacteraceae bacterium]|nr:AgmX/PglI C-terminal domain-containing protein [Anaeromyxobacteraceae bacterium]
MTRWPGRLCRLALPVAAAMTGGALASPPERPPPASAAPDGGAPSGPFGPDAVWAVVEAHQARITACYENRLAEGRGVRGDMVVTFVIGVDGSPQKARVKRNTLGDADVEACVLREVRGWRFPRPPVPQPVELPLRFHEVGPAGRDGGEGPAGPASRAGEATR